ncbi:TetR/AcrR family transcriptional regulator [Aurantibacter crassamenti]|uniref:TetR/AcrR family transcriptional regulator n=1 Tax=Aurantibacter crassamenti TaxID=1837375 RepID=UPI0019397113|nr:TetR/AcrR family transcriptional regulator [Aurantibacter crassamenti]MBM1105022.1 TetR/AcrR family transcriptional regulator [Aurantibacter crassamenti]
MNDKKKVILNAAKTLFNDKGYHNVTIRMIALKLNMSSGNLNYHYKKREDIFEALYFEMVSEFDARVRDLPAVEVSISQIRNDIESSMKRMVAYTFFWTDLYNLLNVSEKVNEHFQGVYKNRKEGCLLLFKKMIEKGLMHKPDYEWDHKFLAERMVNYGNTWLYATGLYTKKINRKDLNIQVNLLLSMLFPYLTPLGKKEFLTINSEFFY